ncbi:MAG: PhoH-like ATPase [bacterium]|jgi:PhoH-like ATPase
MKKKFVLDTNILLHSADSLLAFPDNIVIIPLVAIEELDRFKRRNDELGRNSREVIRRLDELRVTGNLSKGITMENGSTLQIIAVHTAPLSNKLDTKHAENRMIQAVFQIFTGDPSIVFVSKDINSRIKADALGIKVADFEGQKVNINELYTGHRTLHFPTEILTKVREKLYIEIEGFNFLPHEFITLIDEDLPKNRIIVKAVNPTKLVTLNDKIEKIWSIKAKNSEQIMALNLLMDPSINLVTLVGKAGTGKTLLALAAGLESIHKNKLHDKILVSRPIVPLGNDIGYLPGNKDEKLAQWMLPIFDNLSFLMKDGSKGEKKESIEKMDKLFAARVIELEALTYIRGRSIHGNYVIIDEAQNLTPHEIKTIVSRAGENTKIVLTGDPYQIDNPYLDSSSNGLTYVVERLKKQSISGHITLEISERSQLAAIAAELL